MLASESSLARILNARQEEEEPPTTTEEEEEEGNNPTPEAAPTLPPKPSTLAAHVVIKCITADFSDKKKQTLLFSLGGLR